LTVTRRPASTPVRALAALSYLLPVAIGVLAIPAYRRVRFIRLHAWSSLAINLGAVLVVVLFGSLRPGAFELGILIGVLLSLALLSYIGATVWSAIWAYQGRSPPVPGVDALAAKIDRRWGLERELE
jgi:uncharacterized membrane protein